MSALAGRRPALLPRSSTRPVAARRRAPVPCRCSAETEHYFRRRMEEKGWEASVKKHRGQHTLVAEAWAAAQQVYGAPILETPLEPAPWLAELGHSCCVHLKMETRQVTGSFKARGAAHKVLSLTPEQLQRGVVTASTGNHALAVAHACAAASRQRGVPVTPLVYLPTTAAPAKVEKLRAAGAELVAFGQDCLEAEVEAGRVAAERGMTYVSPYNDVQVAGGQGTLALELLMQLRRGHLDTVFVPVGGGGLISGVAAVLKWADSSIHVVGCQPAASDVMRRSVAAGRVVELPWEETLSEATAGGVEKGSITLEACSRFVDEWVTVSEGEIARAMVETSTHHSTPVEGAAGVAVAAYHQLAPRLRGKHCVIILCGGNVSEEAMQRAYQLAGGAAVASAG